MSEGSSMFFFCGVGELYCPKLAILDAVAAHHAAGVVDAVVLEVDAGSLAVPGTFRTVAALIQVDVDLQPREAGEEREHRAHGADGVAVGAAVLPSQRDEHQHGEHGDGKHHAHRRHQYVDRVESIAVDALGDGSQAVVAQFPQRLEDARGDAAVSGVGGE